MGGRFERHAPNSTDHCLKNKNVPMPTPAAIPDSGLKRNRPPDTAPSAMAATRGERFRSAISAAGPRASGKLRYARWLGKYVNLWP